MEVSETDTSADEAVPYLDVSGLEFSYGEVKVLYGLEFQLAPQSIGCVMGRNGVGKTTFLRNLVGLENSSAGKIYIDGSDATKFCLLYTSPSPRDQRGSGMPSCA